MPHRETLEQLLRRVRECTVCAAHLPYPPKPVLLAKATARLIIVGQAPGRKVQETGIPWNDPSGDRLREWLQLSKEVFYDESRIAIIPAGFCYPGKGKSGDMPPRPECAPLWHPPLRAALPKIELTLLVGSYAQEHYLGKLRKGSLSDTVKAFPEYMPVYFPLPHPSPRNRLWLRQRPWFDTDVLPTLRERVAELLG